MLSRKTIAKYQLMFRHLLYLKYLEYALNQSWLDYGKTNSHFMRPGSRDHVMVQKLGLLRTAMVIFVQQCTSYMSYDVIEPKWREFESKCSKQSSMLNVIQYHTDMLDTCLKETMLMDHNVLKAYSKVASLCVYYTRQCQRFYQRYVSSVDAVGASPAGQQSTDERNILKVEKAFSHNMKSLISTLSLASSETPKFQGLATKLDYSVFYANQ